jgi:hypothetical protein
MDECEEIYLTRYFPGSAYRAKIKARIFFHGCSSILADLCVDEANRFRPCIFSPSMKIKGNLACLTSL